MWLASHYSKVAPKLRVKLKFKIMNNQEAIATYNSPTEIEKYYRMQYGPTLKSSTAKNNLTESFYTAISAQLKKYTNSETLFLEVGCGLGRITFESAKLGAKKSTGIDISKKFIAECKKISAGERKNISTFSLPATLNKTVSFLVADAQKLPFSEGTFDVVVCLNVIDRLPQPLKCLESIQKVLKKDGILVIADPYDYYPEFTVQKNRIYDIKQHFPLKSWKILSENKDLPFVILEHPRLKSHYSNHLLVIKKK